MKNLENVKEFTEVIGKGTFGIVMLACTEPSMNKTNNPYYGRLRKLSYTSNVALGYDYASALVAKMKKENLSFDEKEVRESVEKPKGKNWFMHPYILQKDSDAEQKYLRCYYNKNSKTSSIYVLDGKFVTDRAVIADIETWVKKSSGSKKQAELGISKENEVTLRDFKFENVILLKQGEKVYNRLGCMFTPTQMIEFVRYFESLIK